MKPCTFAGTISFTDPETSSVYEIKYKGVYEPASQRGHIDNWTPDESWLELIRLPEELSYYEEELKQLCWKDLENDS
jgi:hypothetical protein